MTENITTDGNETIDNNSPSNPPAPENLHLAGRAISVSLTVNDVEQSRAWYCDVLGFTIHQKHEREGNLMAISLVSGEVKILITRDTGAQGTERIKGEGFSMMITTAQSIDALAAAIKARGVILDSEPANMPWGQRFFRLRDPDGFKYTIASERD